MADHPARITNRLSRLTDLTLMPGDGTNERRADWGEAAILTDPDFGLNEIETTVADVLSNIMHACDRMGVSLDEAYARAQWRYRDEAAGADESGPRAAPDGGRYPAHDELPAL